jgi:hypothetical protein
MNSTIFLLVLLFTTPLYLGQISRQTSPPEKKPGSTTPVFSITLEPPSTPIRLGSPVKITVTITNITSKDIYLDSTRTTSDIGAYRDFQYLLAKDGQEVETTFFHRRMTARYRPDDPQEAPWSGSSILLPHPPGKIWAMTIDLKRLYEIKQAGEYTVIVSRFDDYSKTIVRSNTLRFKIVP